MKTRIVIDRQRMDDGVPAIVVLGDDGVEFANEVTINGPAIVTGVAAGRSPVGGARVWLETEADVEVES